MNIAVTGHRPQSLSTPSCWSTSHPLRVAIRVALTTTLQELIIGTPGGACVAVGDAAEHEIALGEQRIRESTAITGMALGVDQDFARVALDLGMKVHAHTPIDQNSRWLQSSRREYHLLLQEIRRRAGTPEEELCDAIHLYVPEKNESYAHMLQRRNEAMVDAADHLIAVWNGNSHGGTFNCFQYARQHWGCDAVYRLPDICQEHSPPHTGTPQPYDPDTSTDRITIIDPSSLL